jgi:hypothetical protein
MVSQGLSTTDKLRMLLDITKKISRSLDLQEVLNLVMDTLDSLIPYDAAGHLCASSVSTRSSSRKVKNPALSKQKPCAVTTSMSFPICT